MHIVGVGRAFPPNYYDQDQLLEVLRRHWMREHFNAARLERLHKNVLVGGRYLALTLEEYEALETWGQANDAWIRTALDVGGNAVADALDDAGLTARDVDALFTVTVTGVATPSLDARLMNRLDLRPDVKRTPIFGLGCVAGAAGVARAADYVRAFPDQVAVLLSVELCSLTVQKEDLSIPNLIATGLFGDGAAAVVIAGDRVATAEAKAPSDPGGGPRIIDTRSAFYRDTERVMGWDISEKGFGIVLSADVPKMVGRHLRGDLDGFLAEHGLTIPDIGTWICHPGGPKVLTAMEEAFELPRDAFELTWRSLAELGNLSSSSVLMVLGDTLEQRPPAPDSWGVLLAMGPGFCSELVLLRF
ncbi:MAG: 3-oxoacyl-[acyl-carrier-protein] synthase III C-terminal domain-containing protein [Acidobacteriota bacterium]